MAWRGRARLAIVLLALPACSGCSQSDRAVPFKRGLAAASGEAEPGAERAPTAQSSAPTSGPTAATQRLQGGGGSDDGRPKWLN
jgi:hypothetical protein